MKKVEQVLKNGHITLDYDQKLTTSEIFEVYNTLFPNKVIKDDKQCILYGKIGLLTANVTYLGHPWPLYKKRIQLKTYFPEYLKSNLSKGLQTFYVGIYTYNKTRLFVIYEPSTYANKKSHNSAAHVQTFDLQYAQKAGDYSKVDASGNKIHIFKTGLFVKFIKDKAGETNHYEYEDVLKLIDDYVFSFTNGIPKTWNGINCYKEMFAANDNNALQTEWPGFYFEFLFKKQLNSNPTSLIKWNSDKTESGIDFDLAFDADKWLYGDLKTDEIKRDILGNSFETFDRVIKEHSGEVYYLCCLYSSKKDRENGYVTTKFWNSYRKNPYETEDEIRNGYGKKMKYEVTLKELRVIKIDSISYDLLKLTPFMQGKNSDGKQRNPKLMIKKDLIDALSIYTHIF